jgi:hypothetical protein
MADHRTRLPFIEPDPFVAPLTSRIFRTDLVLHEWFQGGLHVRSGNKDQTATVDASGIKQGVGKLSASGSERLGKK